MSNSTFLITNRGTFSIKQTRIGLVTLGILMLIFNLSVLFTSADLTNLNPFMILMAVSFIITGTVGLSKNSKFSPKVFMNSNHILIKEGLWSGSQTYNWTDIREITLGSYKITIGTERNKKTFHIDSTPQISIDIKRTLKEVASKKNITLIGG